jgi:hypothetical protein
MAAWSMDPHGGISSRRRHAVESGFSDVHQITLSWDFHKVSCETALRAWSSSCKRLT